MMVILIDYFIDDYSDDNLSGSMRRLRVRSYLPDLIELGYSGSAALTKLKSVGLGIRTSDFYDIYHEIEGTTLPAFKAVRGVISNQLDPDTFGALRIPQDENYLYAMKYEYYDEESDTYKTGRHVLRSNDLGTKTEIEDTVYDDLAEMYPHRARNLQSTWLVGAYRYG